MSPPRREQCVGTVFSGIRKIIISSQAQGPRGSHIYFPSPRRGTSQAIRTTCTSRQEGVIKLLSRFRARTAAMAKSSTSGTTNMTDSGSFQSSYSATSIRYTNITQRAKMYMEVLPMRFSWNAKSVHSIPIPSGRTSEAIFSISAIASPVLWPLSKAPIISAHG